MTAHITLEQVQDEAALEAVWRAHEAGFGARFFQTWTWLGCLFAQRFTDPVLLRGTMPDGRLIALGLFNRTRFLGLETLYLHETGNPIWDATYIEHNGFLIAPDAPAGTIAACVRAARSGAIAGRKPFPSRRLILSGVDERSAAISGTAFKLSDAPYADLSTCQGDSARWLASLRPNARQQVARARRAYERSGPITCTRSATVTQAQTTFAAMVALHQARWMARGKPGAFAGTAIRHFHETLLARGTRDGTVSLREVASGGAPFAVLYDFSDPFGVRAYQSGFVYGTNAGKALQPGLVAHAAVLDQIASTGAYEYDFLAGDAQYKRMLSGSCRKMRWLHVSRFGFQ